VATRYARNVTGNWNDLNSWSDTGSGGVAGADYAKAGDTAIFDSGFTGNITIAASAACATLTCQAGATGTLTWGAGQRLSTTANVAFVSGFHLSGDTGILRISGPMTLTMGGLTVPGTIEIFSNSTFTLGDDAACGTLINSGGATTAFAGAHNIACDVFTVNGLYSLSLVAGQTLLISTGINIAVNAFGAATIKSATASSDAFLHYNGTAANCKIAGAIFTDINCAHAIDNWYGGTLLRCTNITNRTSADFATAAQASDIYAGTVISGITGTLHASNISTAAGSGSDLSAGILKSGEVVDDVAGTFTGGGGGGGLPILSGSVVRGIR
jgi:hypothetical protein